MRRSRRRKGKDERSGSAPLAPDTSSTRVELHSASSALTALRRSTWTPLLLPLLLLRPPGLAPSASTSNLGTRLLSTTSVMASTESCAAKGESILRCRARSPVQRRLLMFDPSPQCANERKEFVCPFCAPPPQASSAHTPAPSPTPTPALPAPPAPPAAITVLEEKKEISSPR